MNNVVDRIVINDYDKAVYSFWRALKEEPEKFISLIDKTPLTIDEWKNQKAIYSAQHNKYSIELGFSAFYLNRTNRSGILGAGPIGGQHQNGNYDITARFNRDALSHRIRNIVAQKDRIIIYNKEIRSFIKHMIPKYQDNAFVYFDPPYYNKGQRLYKNFLSPSDHADIAQCIIDNVDCQWIITYDDVPQVNTIYPASFIKRRYTLNYSAGLKGRGSEVIVFKSPMLLPSNEEIHRYMPNFDLV